MKATLDVDSVPKDLFAVEDKELSNNRAHYTITETDTGLHFEIEAQDSVALRAVLTSITKTLTVYEKMRGVNDEPRTN